ncbi:Protein phosphatase 2C 2 [Clydaea vesicula]|uniref:protein-serine/threonine phosphatase n=1 Tax=Clydaea vesicula TaxID=447962 RepID=A0AAD5TVV3_9FUNG|nr:Protein phosphatase 2C 2 [Clydaea vesicula]
MEDAHTTLLNINKSEEKKISMFAVFDGHGGSNVAQYCGKKLQHLITLNNSFDESIKSGDFSKVLTESFLNLDVELRKDPEYAKEPSGCTAVSCIISSDWKITAANAGDSRIVLGSKTGKAIPLSFDHKPTNEIEIKRITDAGGFVEYGRVNGNLALSRAIGDFVFKDSPNLTAEQQIVTANPDIIQHDIEDGDEFLVLACDGIWDCMTNQEVVDFVRYKIKDRNGDLKLIAEEIMDFCLAPICDLGSIGCDNMTVIIVGFTRGRSREEWVNEIAAKIDEKLIAPKLRNIKPAIISSESEYDANASHSDEEATQTDV